MSDNPPVMQVLLTVQFEPALSTLNLLQLSELAGKFTKQYPLFSQVARAGPMPVVFGQQEFEVNLGLPRFQMVSEDLAYKVFLQDDRVSIGWSRTVPIDVNPDYSGFADLRQRFFDAVSLILDYADAAGCGELKPKAGELLYEDGFAQKDSNGNLRRISEIYNFLNPEFYLPTNGFNWTWSSALEGLGGFAESSATGIYRDPAGNFYTQLQTTIRFDLSAMTWEEAMEACGVARDNANRLFETVVNPNLRAT